MRIEQQIRVEDDTPEEWERVEQYAKKRRQALTQPPTTAGSPPASASASSPAKALWHTLSALPRCQEVLKILPGDRSLGLTPTEMSQHMKLTPQGTLLHKRSVQATIRNLRHLECRLKKEEKITRAVIQADWSDANRAGRYYLLPEDKAVIDTL